MSAVLLSNWIFGAVWISRRSNRRFLDALATWGIYGSIWFCLLDIWEWAWIVAGLSGWNSLSVQLAVTPQFWLAFCISGWITTLVFVANLDIPAKGVIHECFEPSQTCSVWLACGCYIVVFTAMNWGLYFNLLIPHGDSAMYEEHLWNLLHGKGFRSYLDQGLFLGEHIQFVHLFLIPLYILWPSHLLLELAESTALALGALPVYWMATRQTHSLRTALLVAVVYLLYTPTQFLDIEIDLKTFRPEAFGIPLLLLTLDQLDRRNLRGFLIGLAFTLTVKEDYAIVFAPLGLWILFHEWRSSRPTQAASAANVPTATGCHGLGVLDVAVPDEQSDRNKRWIWTGIALTLGSVLYLWLATRVIMPWFRSGAEVHYVRYFSKFGETPEQIIRTMVTQPGLLFGELVSPATILYAIALLAPLALLPLFSPGRLAVGMPLFGILCLNELAKDPRHQFHAPLVAILFWALVHGLPRATECLKSLGTRLGCASWTIERSIPVIPTTMLWASALTTCLFFSLSPLGIPFWDPGSSWNWRRLYAPSERAAMFVHVLPLVPPSSRVASTDFVHPRFTHHERSYDYSGYLRKVSDYEQKVPDDTDFIVIDTGHPYSRIKQPEEVPEYHDHPDQWELLPDETRGFFIVLRRRH